MINGIKAIPTIYNGQKYRSKLEAEYAKGMDEAGVAFVYEPEGFVLSDGTKYLPDFYLPDYDLFIEVKGIMSDLDQHKIDMFRKDSGKRLFVAKGQDLELDTRYMDICIYDNLCISEDDEKHKKIYKDFYIWPLDKGFEIFVNGGEDFFVYDDWHFIMKCSKCHKHTLHDNQDSFICGHCGNYDGGNPEVLHIGENSVIVKRKYIDYRNTEA